MKVEIRITNNFRKQAKFLIKKHPSLLNELKALEKDLTNNPQLGSNSYKIRLSIKSKGKGKSGGARVVTHIDDEIVAMVEKV